MCERERERERESIMCVFAQARTRVCMCVCVRARARVCVCDCANFARKVVVCGMCKTMRARALSHCINELFVVVVYAGVSILNNARTAKHSVDKHHSNFTVLFAGGAAVQVAERQGLLHLIVCLLYTSPSPRDFG